MTLGFTPSPFRPAWWLPGGHLQTLGARLLRPASGVPFARKRLELPDGDFVDLDFPFPESGGAGAGGPLVLLLHGLEGSARSKYALETYRALRRGGVASVGLNFRSCSGELNRLPRLYHSGDTADLAYVVQWLRDTFPGRPLGVVGFSIGGNVLLKWLGERGASVPPEIRAAAAVSVPFDLSAGADYLDRVGGRVYVAYLLGKLRRKVKRKWAAMPDGVDVPRALRARTFREFDDAATAPLHAFAGAEEYYARSSSAAFLPAIRVPTLLIHALNDPFLPPESVPMPAVRENPHLVQAVSPDGGHVGFVAGDVPWRPRFWAEGELARFLGVALATDPGAAGPTES